MRRFVLLCAVPILLSGGAAARQKSPPAVPSAPWPTGVIIPNVVCVRHPDQRYTLYLPSYYSRKRRWPIVYAFDPLARGSLPVELMKDAAERYGYIVASSNQAHNGPWKPLRQAAQSVYEDTHERLAIDNARLYFAGFSGTARFAATLAELCKCAAGVLLDGAGFARSSPPARGAGFAVFLTVGDLDFNYGEVVDLDAKLGKLRFAHVLRRFDGAHEWPPAGVFEEAFAWFRLLAMKDGREARDTAFVQNQVREAQKRAKALALAGDAYGRWQEYRQDAETFDGLSGEAALFRKRARALHKEKAVQTGEKLEREEIEEQSSLMGGMYAGMAALRQNGAHDFKLRSKIESQISNLRIRTRQEKNPRTLLVDQRALSGISMEALEAGEGLLGAKSLWAAQTYFELAVTAEPDDVVALRELAVARALSGDDRGAIAALQSAKEKGKDPAAFSSWLKKETAFAPIRNTPEFRDLLTSPHKSR